MALNSAVSQFMVVLSDAIHQPGPYMKHIYSVSDVKALYARRSGRPQRKVWLVEVNVS